MASSTSTIAAAFAAYLLEVTTKMGLTGPSGAAAAAIINDRLMFLMSVMGSLGGAMVATLMFMPRTPRTIISKFISSSLAGMIFGPAVVRAIGMDINLEYVLGTTGLLSLISWGLLLELTPKLASLVSEKVLKWVNRL